MLESPRKSPFERLETGKLSPITPFTFAVTSPVITPVGMRKSHVQENLSTANQNIPNIPLSDFPKLNPTLNDVKLAKAQLERWTSLIKAANASGMSLKSFGVEFDDYLELKATTEGTHV